MPDYYVCKCVVRGCARKDLDGTGNMGAQLSRRLYKKHQDEEKQRLYEVHRVAQKQASAAQHRSIESALERLSINDDPAPVPDVKAKRIAYKADYKKELIDKMSRSQEQIEKLIAEATQLGVAPERTSVPETERALERCRQIRSSTEGVDHVIVVAASGQLRKEASIATFLNELQEDFSQLLALIDEIERSWKTAAEKLCQREDRFTSDAHFIPIFKGTSTIIQLASLMVVVCSVILGLPRRGCWWLFRMCAYIVETTAAAAFPNGIMPSFLVDIIKSFPRDVRASTNKFRLDGEATIYAVCPKCHATYAPDGPKDMPQYRERCNSDRYGQKCTELLLRSRMLRGKKIYLPIKPYVVYDFEDWLANLLSRTGYKTMMDQAWARMDVPPSGLITDIFQGSVIREFKGPDKRTHFSQTGKETSGRYLFSMGFDFFNPLRNLANGKKVSVGVITLVCLNLPIHLRYKPENMFLAGIIPGPKEPSLDAINPYLRPIVDIFLKLWKGIRFTRTSNFPEIGRLLFCALIAIICDLPAARKIGGFASCAHEYFCSMCWCTKTQHGYNNYDYASWKRRTNIECRRRAILFRDAQAEKDAARLFDQSGLRYSELLRLPYFDPTKHLVVDPMHNLFLGLIKEHFQNILGYIPKGVRDRRKNAAQKSDAIHLDISPSESNPLPEDPKERASIRKLSSYLKERLNFDKGNETESAKVIKRWSSVHTSALVYVGRSLRCMPDTLTLEGKDMSLPFPKRHSKNYLATILLDWRFGRIQFPLPDRNHPDVPFGNIFTEAEIKVLWSDIESLVKPSWATSVPPTVTSVGPKLKSDQWRSMGSLSMPISLIRLWSDVPGIRHDLLHLTMLLCSAICIATSRTISSTQADEYQRYMIQYRTELERIFPRYKCHPNHHMAMHIGEFLSMYGPVHGWWTFPFERMIGMLQRIPTNYKPGEYEATISKSWHRSSNFRALFTKQNCPDAIRYCVDMFETLVRPQNRTPIAYNSALEDEDHDEEPEFDTDRSKILSAEIIATLRAKLPPRSFIPSSAESTSRLTVDGITYATSGIHDGNSGVFERHSNIPFSIVNILKVRDLANVEKTWFLVRRHKPAPIQVDPYARYPHIRAKIWGLDLEDAIEAIPFSQVEGHFAKSNISWEGHDVSVIVSLSKSHVV